MYKASAPRFSKYYNREVVDILKRKRFIFFHYWTLYETVYNAGQVDEVVCMLNNPEVLKQRIRDYIKNNYDGTKRIEV